MQSDCELAEVQECTILLSSENGPQYTLSLPLPVALSLRQR